MISGEEIDLVNFVQLMIVKDLDILILQKVKVYLVAIISDTHNKGPLGK